MTEGQKSGPSEDEYQGQISSIQQIFAEYDHNGSGKVRVERIPDLILNLGRDLQVGREVARQLSGSGSVEVATFEEVVQTLKKVEETQDREVDGETTTPLTLLKRLNAYKKQCESNGEYVEAQKARKKYEELRAKEEERQRRLVDQAQQQEMMEVEQAQRAQFLGFSNAWDKYMADYESTAYMSLERLKEQHGEELSKFQEMIRHQPARVKCSRELLELRRKQEALAKLGKYEEAWKVKEEGDQLEQWEQARSASLVSDSAKRQEGRLRSQQQKALQALLKRIQRDRGEQIRHRQMDSQRLIQRNKNLKADLYKKQHLEFQRAEAAIRSIMSQPEHAQRLLDEHDPASVARSAAMGELPALGRIKWKGPSLPENYMPPGGISKGLVKTARPRQESEEISKFGKLKPWQVEVVCAGPKTVWLLLARTVQTCRFGAREASFWSLAVTGDLLQQPRRFHLGLSIWQCRGDRMAKDLLELSEEDTDQLRFEMVAFETPEEAMSLWEACVLRQDVGPTSAHLFVRVMLFDAQKQSMAALHFAQVVNMSVCDPEIQADHKALQQLLSTPGPASSRLAEVLSPLIRGNCKSFLLCTVPERPGKGDEARKLLDLAEQASLITANCQRLQGKRCEDFHWAKMEDVLGRLRSPLPVAEPRSPEAAALARRSPADDAAGQSLGPSDSSASRLASGEQPTRPRPEVEGSGTYESPTQLVEVSEPLVATPPPEGNSRKRGRPPTTPEEKKSDEATCSQEYHELAAAVAALRAKNKAKAQAVAIPRTEASNWGCSMSFIFS
ncbi:unnamed protein product [Cladocopium goreaui]|uniref:EF-hand domain-containing protein n=1 Tax=Cladocopium goreaui TaxID=2562237 RepID=A0A9P1GC08_9DINO|nr:unnamed protein product [Cladocopium goreaui]